MRILNSEVLPTWGRPMIPVFILMFIDSVYECDANAFCSMINERRGLGCRGGEKG